MMRFLTALAAGFGLLATTTAAPISSSTAGSSSFVCDKTDPNSILPGVGAPNTCTPWQYEGLPGPSLEYVSYPILLTTRGSAFTTLDVLFKEKLAEFEQHGHPLDFDVDAVKRTLCKEVTIPSWENDYLYTMSSKIWVCLEPLNIIKEKDMAKRDVGSLVPIELPSEATMAQLRPYLENTTFVPQYEFDMLPGPIITSQELIEKLCTPLEGSVCAAHPHVKRWVNDGVLCKDSVEHPGRKVCYTPEDLGLECRLFKGLFDGKVCWNPLFGPFMRTPIDPLSEPMKFVSPWAFADIPSPAVSGYTLGRWILEHHADMDVSINEDIACKRVNEYNRPVQDNLGEVPMWACIKRGDALVGTLYTPEDVCGKVEPASLGQECEEWGGNCLCVTQFPLEDHSEDMWHTGPNIPSTEWLSINYWPDWPSPDSPDFPGSPIKSETVEVEAGSRPVVERTSGLEKRCWKCIFNCALCK